MGERVVLGVGFHVAVVRVVGQADAVAEQVGHGEAFGGLRRAQLEPGHVVGDLAVPAQRAVVDQQAGHGAGERLGQRCQAEHGVRIDHLRVVDVGDAVAARAEHTAALDDGHGHAGDALAVGQLLGHRFDRGHVEALGRRQHLHVGGRGAIGGRLGVRDRRGIFDVDRERGRRSTGRLCSRRHRDGHQHAQQPGGRRTDRATPAVLIHRLGPVRNCCG